MTYDHENKRNLGRRAAPSPASEASREPKPAEIAEAGLRGPSSPLPHSGELARVFGEDLGAIRVHEGPEAKLAADHLGAHAFAHRGEIVLGDKRDLPTLAEEAAHVLQQRQGGADHSRSIADPLGASEREAKDAASVANHGAIYGAPTSALAADSVALAKKEKPASDRKPLSSGEIKKLKKAGHDPHELKGGKNASKFDLYKDVKGNIFVHPKGGAGPGDPTNININDL